ncbi:hypothetical protein DI43_01705 [Geobacillus sp. CAMR12739]|nr:hypothetical protein DI43_01705 [Geobacillus sp. CAMR12739]
MRATAGDGQKNQEMIIIKIPIVQYAQAGVRMKRTNGETMTSLMPVADNTLLIATIIEMTKIVGNSSAMA